MRALSINQPWAWAIVEAGKDIENRVWRTNYRGKFWIHAGKKFDVDGLHWICSRFPGIKLPTTWQMGGVIGSDTLVDCLQQHSSQWFFGPFGYTLKNAKPCRFRPCRGYLNFFKVGGKNDRVKRQR